MVILLLGLIIFLGVHSLRIFAEDGRNQLIARVGRGRFRSVYSVLSLIGLLLVIYGYGQARFDAVPLWSPPTGLRHLVLLLVPVAFVLVASAYAPAGYIKSAIRHPMVLGVALWAFAHLLANGASVDVVLFGAFLIWALVDYGRALRRTDTSRPEASSAKTLRGDVIAVGAGLALSAAFVFGLHGWLIGVPLLG